MDTNSILRLLTRLFAEQFVVYLVATVPIFLLFWVLGKRYVAHRRIQPVRRATNRQLLREVLNSAGFVLIYACVDAFLLRSSDSGASHVYTDLHQHGGLPCAVLTCFLFFVIDDTYFYWSHRLLHQPGFYRLIHRVHHESTDPSPFTAYSFHPLEGLVEIGSVVLVALYASYLPVHVGALIGWQVGAIAFNVIGHLGYEIYPATWHDHWLLGWKTPSTHHNLHHEQVNGNYGLYFTCWDRWMGTEFEDYTRRYHALFTRPSTFANASLPVPSLPNSTEVSDRLVFAQVTIRLADRQVVIGASADENLLAAALRQAVVVPYGCRQGRCGLCQARCVQGQVRELTTGPLSQTQQQAGYVLMCQSYPKSAQLTIDYTRDDRAAFAG